MYYLLSMKEAAHPMKLHLLFVTLLLGLTLAAPLQRVGAQSFDPILAGRLQSKIDSFSTANNLKGVSAGVFYPGMGTWKGVTGLSHTGTPMTSDLLFGIASNTKLFTGVLLLKLAEHNLVHLDDSLHEFLPAYSHIDSNITIRQLLNHTSGLFDVTSFAGYSDSMLANPNRVFTASELMTWAGPPLFQAGTGWTYCNTNYLLAGLIAESATGRSYSQLLRDTILTPLQLDSTFLDVYEPLLYPVAHPWQGGMNFNATPRTSINSAAWSAGAMYSTSGEMLQWYRALMGGMVINAQSMNELTTFVGSGNYGMGISRVTVLGRTVWTHGGLIWGGYNSSMMYDPATGIVICVLINQLPAQANQLSIQLLYTLLSNPLTILEPSMTERHMNVYPNPTRSRVELDVPNQTILHVQVYDRKGMLVQETSDRVLDLSHEPSGLYFIRVQTAKGYYNGKLIKQ